MPPKKFSLKMAVIDIPDGEDRCSSSEVHFGVPWYLSLEHKDGELAAYLHCHREKDEEKPWSIETEYEFRLFSATRQIKETESSEHVFVENVGWGTESFYNWKDAVGENSADQTAVIQCDVTINKMTGIAPKRLRNFEEQEEHLTDVVLKVAEQKFHVSKAILAAQSSYFKSMFFGNFDEAKKKEIELNDVDPDAFQALLEIIYGELYVKAEHVERVLQLSDKFDVPKAQKRCEVSLLESDEVSKTKKLVLADTFKLGDLMKDCLDSIQTNDQLITTLPTNLTSLKRTTVLALFEKNISLFLNSRANANEEPI